MYSVDFVGLNYFNVLNGKVRVLSPDGTDSGFGMPAHFASVFVAAENLVSDDWWPAEKLKREIEIKVSLTKSEISDVYEFRLPERAEVTFDCGDAQLDTTNLPQELPHLRTIDPDFELDEEGTIARIPIAGGTLEVYRFDPAAVVRWTIAEHAERITITARSGREAKTITVAAAANEPLELVFANTSDLLDAHADHDDGGHFVLYGKLNKGRNGVAKFESAALPKSYTHLEMLPFHHPYMKALVPKKEIPNVRCIPICC